MKKFLTFYSLIFAIGLTFGEAAIVLNSGKYWPLSLDDFIGVGALIFALVLNASRQAAGLYLAAWTYIAGNIYAVLFMRLDPVSGTGERIPLLILVLVLSLLGALLSLLSYRKEIDLTPNSQ